MKTDTFNEEEILACMRHYLTHMGYWEIKDMDLTTENGVSLSVSYERNIYDEDEDE